MSTKLIAEGALKALHDAQEVVKIIDAISQNAVSGQLDSFEVRQGYAMDLLERTERLQNFAMWTRG